MPVLLYHCGDREPYFLENHVFQNLRPYVCTFKDYSQGSHLYKGRHEWFTHESEMHRRKWFCSKCKKAFPSSEKFREHLIKKHKHVISNSKEQLDILIDRGARAIEEKQKYPFCQEKYTPRQLRSHLGRHLEQIALFVLPESSYENEDSGSNPDSDDEISTAPNTKSRTASLGRRFQGQLSATGYFFKTGPRINVFDGDGCKAAQSGDLKRATLLLESGCDLVAISQCYKKLHPLHIAARNGHAEVVSVLLEQKTVDINSKDGSCRETAPLSACGLGHENFVKLLLKRKDVDSNAKDNEECTALIRAYREGRQSFVQSLLERKDIDVNAKDNEGRTAFIWACRGHEHVVEMLLRRKDIDVNANDNEGRMARACACRMDHERVVKLLLTQSNIEPKKKDKYGCTALMLAIMGGYRSIVKLLLAQDGFEVNVKVTTEKQHS